MPTNEELATAKCSHVDPNADILAFENKICQSHPYLSKTSRLSLYFAWPTVFWGNNFSWVCSNLVLSRTKQAG